MNWRRNRSYVRAVGLVICLILLGTLSACDQDDGPTATDPVITESSIRVVNIDPKPGAVVSSDDVIKATLTYRIADDEVSEYGFSVGIVFRAIEGGLFAVGGESKREVFDRVGRFTIDYPLSRVWDFRPMPMEHPPQVYFHLYRETSDSTAAVLSRTEEIQYAEEGL